MCTNPEMRSAFLRELRDELAARRRTPPGETASPRGWRPAARALALPVAALAVLAVFSL